MTFPLAACLIALTLLAGCRSVGRTTLTTPKTHVIPAEATASLKVIFVTLRQEKFHARIQQLMSTDLSAGLVDAGISKSVSNSPKEANYQIEARVVKMRLVGTAKRLFFGNLAGRSYLRVQFIVRQKTTDNVIASFQVTGYGARTAIGAQSYGYDDPVREVVAHAIKNMR